MESEAVVCLFTDSELQLMFTVYTTDVYVGNAVVCIIMSNTSMWLNNFVLM